ncbi:MAG: GGDEF domain-containing protein [Deltaproteobacteria bacterium]|nr:GGDEF domain-containing protein [Deltaproteobacteria bacterium]
MINFGREQTKAFTNHDIKILIMVANQIALALANANLYSKTKELSLVDELTSVYNRRHFGQVMQIEWKRSVRFHRPLSLLMIDADHFKKYNDTYGHPKGDQVLKAIGKLLLGNLREVDTVARFGGEEFVILLPDTDKKGALSVAEKLRKLVEQNIAAVTVSIGVATYPDDVKEMDDLIDHADIALYQAKDYGRNRVYLYEGQQSSSVEKVITDPKSRLIH